MSFLGKSLTLSSEMFLKKLHSFFLILVAFSFASCAQKESSSSEHPNLKLDEQGIQLSIAEITDTAIVKFGTRVKIEIDVLNNKDGGTLEISGHRESIDSVSIIDNKIVILRKGMTLNDSIFTGTVYCRKDNGVQSKADFEIKCPVRELRINLVNLTSDEYVLNKAHELSLEVEGYDNVSLSCSGGKLSKIGDNWKFIPNRTDRVKLTLSGKSSNGYLIVLRRWELDVQEQ